MAKVFRFRLEKVLGYRRMLERKQKYQLLEALGRYRKLENDLELIEKRRFETFGVGVFLDLMYYRDQAREGYEMRIQDLKKALIDMEHSLETLRVGYMEFRKESKVLEMLKEKCWEKYKEVLRKEEEKELDDQHSYYRRFRKEIV